MKIAMLYILYIYHPENPIYFDQADVLKTNENLLLDEILEKLCNKNSCSSEEIELIKIFDNKENLNRYLFESEYKYLLEN